MAIYPVAVQTEALDLADLRKKVRAYRALFEVEREILVCLKGTFKDRAGDLVFLAGKHHQVTITPSAIKWFDPGVQKTISITPVERFSVYLYA